MAELPNSPFPDPHVPQTEGLQIGDHRLSTSRAVVERPGYLFLVQCTFRVMQCQRRLQISQMKNIGSVFELSGVAFRLASPLGGLLVQMLQSLRIHF